MNRSDDFNRADSTSSLGSPSDGGSAWSALAGTWGINTNRGYSPSGGQAVAVLEASAADVRLEAVIQTAGSDYGLVVRASDNSNYWLLAITATNFVLYRKEAGSFTNETSGPAATVNGDTVRFEANGTSLKGYLNGVEKLSFTSSFNQSATQHGIRSNTDAVVRFDDLTITDLSPAGAGPRRARHKAPIEPIFEHTW